MTQVPNIGSTIPESEVADLIAPAERLSPERHPEQAVELNQYILQRNPANAATHVRLARAYQAQRKFAEAKAACQEALRLDPGNTVAMQRLQRIAEEFACATQAQAVTHFEEASRRGVEQKDQEYAGLAIASLWRAVELSTAFGAHWNRNSTEGSLYRTENKRQ